MQGRHLGFWETLINMRKNYMSTDQDVKFILCESSLKLPK